MNIATGTATARTSGYDIGIGQCASIDASTVAVRLDSAMVSRLAPAERWRTFGSTLLWLGYDQCSTRRPPVVGAEVYLDSAMLDSVGHAMLDVGNTGARVDIDLAALIRDTHPAIEPATEPRTSPKPWQSTPLPPSRRRSG